jgi:hypothetical protein
MDPRYKYFSSEMNRSKTARRTAAKIADPEKMEEYAICICTAMYPPEEIPEIVTSKIENDGRVIVSESTIAQRQITPIKTEVSSCFLFTLCDGILVPNSGCSVPNSCLCQTIKKQTSQRWRRIMWIMLHLKE